MSLALWVDVPAASIRRYVKDDPDDDVIVACAVVSEATHIVSYDPHLLNLKEPFPGCVVLNSLQFLFLVRGDKSPLRIRFRNWLRKFMSKVKRITKN